MWYFNYSSLPLLLIVAVFTLIYFYSKKQFSFWSKIGVPFKKPHWLFGNFGDFVRGKTSLAELTVEIHEQFKNQRFGGIWRFFSPILFISDPNLLRNIFATDFGTWSSRGIVVNVETDPLSQHLVLLDGKKWKSVRTKLTPTFTSAKLKKMYNLLLECGNELEKYLDNVVANDDGIVEAREMSARFTTDVIGSCIFGIQMNALSQEESTFRKMGKKIFEPSLKKKIVRTLQTGFPGLFKLLKLSVNGKELNDFFLKITRDNMEYREKNNVERNDFIDLLRGLKNTGTKLDEDEVEFDDKVLAAQAFVFFAAGFETSSTVISYCLHELAVNQQIQNRLREEIHKTKGEASNGEITWDDLKNMKYLAMIVQETLRKYPPIPLLVRVSDKPYKIPDTDVVLPSGTTCAIPIYALHHDSDYYPEPEKFDPERFSAEAKNQRAPFTFIPFGDGPRICIGLRFAEQQTKLALVEIIDKFKITLSEKSQNPLQLDPRSRFLFPKGGIWIRVSKNLPPTK